MTISEGILNGISREVTVELNEEYFNFESGIKSVKLYTFICVSNRNGSPKVVSVGEELESEPSADKFELFSNQSQSDKLAILIYFVKHGLSLVTSKYALINPTVICKGVSNFKKIFHGYEEGIFQHVFSEAGAVRVYLK